MSWTEHLLIVPILLPLVTGALLLFVDERRRHIKARISIASSLVLVGVSIALMIMTASGPEDGLARVGVYRLGNWPAPFAIVLVLDRLASLMLLVTSILGASALVFSVAKWQRAGAHFNALFQFQLMGLNGAFLTGDLFNLFVFFEVMLAASYGLLLHGSELRRVKAGLHYIAINLLASSLFLIGVSLIYGVAGTLNMADLAVRLPQVAAENRGLVEAGMGVLGAAFLIKAGMYPLGFWLPDTYAAAAPPVGAMFSILTKVGVYVLLRLSLLYGVGESVLLWGGVATIAFGSIGVLATQDLSRLAGFSVLVSSGTLLAAIGTGQASVIGGALFYLVSSTLAISAFFLVSELVERGREAGADVLAVTLEAFGDGDEVAEEQEEVGAAIPATLAILGTSFVGCALLLAGLPPLAGFLGKFAMLTGLFSPESGASPTPTAWVLLTVLLLSGAATLIAMSRAGIRIFWLPLERSVPQVRLVELAPVVCLLLLCAVLTVRAGPVMGFMQETASFLHAPQQYIQGVLGAGR